ncbi:MAG: TetR/AcrR family transcriptional regulator [Polyangiaceae bacterium]|nr:TetR/AcrR family transcriptional regulator [Polyangiaceae bacterium]
MARPTVIRNEVILEAARAVFLERGILATSAEVAQRAGVSEGSIFKRFKTKGELFRAAMGVDLENVLPALQDLVSRAGTRTVEQNLVEAGIETVLFFERIMPIVMMSWSNPKVPGCPHGYSQDPAPLRAQRHVADYLALESRLGRIRTSAPDVIARAYLGALSHYVFSEMLAQCAAPTSSPDGADAQGQSGSSAAQPEARRGWANLAVHRAADVPVDVPPALIDREDYVRNFVRVLVSGMELRDVTRAA